jgi:hypothetical protein
LKDWTRPRNGGRSFRMQTNHFQSSVFSDADIDIRFCKKET